MFLYGLYTIESHHQQKQQQHQQHQQQQQPFVLNRKASAVPPPTQPSTVVGRQKSYSISDGCHLNSIRVGKRSSHGFLGETTPLPLSLPLPILPRPIVAAAVVDKKTPRSALAALDRRNRLKQTSICCDSNVSKYELNLCKFEFYLEKLRKQEEQSKLENFLQTTKIINNQSIVCQRRNTVHTTAAAWKKCSSSELPDRLAHVNNGRGSDKNKNHATSKSVAIVDEVEESSCDVDGDGCGGDSDSNETFERRRQRYQRLNTNRRSPSPNSLPSVSSSVSSSVSVSPRKQTFPHIEAFRSAERQQQRLFRSFDATNSALINVKRNCKSSNTKKWLASLMGRFRGAYSSAN